jgi:hypothetical protein
MGSFVAVALDEPPVLALCEHPVIPTAIAAASAATSTAAANFNMRPLIPYLLLFSPPNPCQA